MRSTDKPETLTLEVLQKAVRDSSAIRSSSELAPQEGDGTKVFPSTYVKGGKSGYATEQRLVNKQTVSAVLLNSVAAEANLLESALQDAIEEGTLEMPLLQMDYTVDPATQGQGVTSTLEAPHRFADASFRDGLLDGVPFPDSEVGKDLFTASVSNATALYKYCPHAAILGVWCSTGLSGGPSNKFARVFTSEIYGINVVAGVKTASRLDPLEIGSHVKIYKNRKGGSGDWTCDPEQAAKDSKGDLVVYKKEGTPAEINHGNIPPTVDSQLGGVTFEYAKHSTVLSFTGLRKLKFRTDVDGNLLSGEARREGQHAARTVLAALTLTGVVLRRAQGFSLRSRCLLMPQESLVLELLGESLAEGSIFYTLTPEEALTLLRQAVKQAEKWGFGWDTTPITLLPSPQLIDLIRRSANKSD